MTKHSWPHDFGMLVLVSFRSQLTLWAGKVVPRKRLQPLERKNCNWAGTVLLYTHCVLIKALAIKQYTGKPNARLRNLLSLNRYLRTRTGMHDSNFRTAWHLWCFWEDIQWRNKRKKYQPSFPSRKIAVKASKPWHLKTDRYVPCRCLLSEFWVWWISLKAFRPWGQSLLLWFLIVSFRI